ncbi:MAG: efflux transporter outer membrane subunit [Thiolinea sp.]
MVNPYYSPALLLIALLIVTTGCTHFKQADISVSAGNNAKSAVAVKTTPAMLKQTLPANWTATPVNQLTPGEVVSGNWWTGFGDVHLNRLVARAAGHNYQIAQSKAQSAQARAQAIIAGAGRLPTVSAGLNTSRTRQEAGAAGFLTNQSHQLSLLNVAWEADLWGRLRAQSAAANASYLASNDALRAVRQAVAAQTAKAYFAVVESRQQRALSQRTLQVIAETARQVGNRADVGIASPADKYLSIANRDSAKAGLAAYQEAVNRATRQLQLLTGSYPDGQVVTANALVNTPALPKAGLPAGLLARRPDVLAAERKLRASGFNLSAAERSLLPTISLSSGLGTASTGLRNLLNGNFGFWNLAGTLLQPIFQGGRLQANVRLNEARQQEAAHAYAQTALTALSEVETALSVRADISRRQAALCSAANAAKAAERIAFNRYREGIEPFLTVLESQQRTLNAASACITARRAGLENYIDLQLALGGGFEAQTRPLPTMRERAQERVSVLKQQLKNLTR